MIGKSASLEAIPPDSISKEFLCEILENIDTGVLVIDASTLEIVYANKEIERISGYALDEIMGQVCCSWLCSSDVWRCPLADLKQSIYKSECNLLNKYGKEVPVTKTVVPIIIENKEYYVESIADNAKRNLAEQALTESERSKSMLLANLPGMAYRCRYDCDWTMQFVSEGCFALTGYKPDSLLYNKDLAYNDIISPKYRELLFNEWARIINGNKIFKYEYPIITASGEEKWVYEQGQPIYNESGEIIALEGLIIDIDDKIKAQLERENLLQQTQSMFNEHNAVMLLIEPETGTILDANPSALSFYGYSKDELLSMKIQDINVLPAEEIKVLRANALEKKQKYFNYPHRLKNGTIKMVDVYSSPINYNGGKVLYSIIVDETDREEAYSQIKKSETYDFLTGVHNRKYYKKIRQEMDCEECLPLSIMVADINGVRLINESYGVEAGDKLICETARLIGNSIRENDFLARTGGDEFSILMPNTDQAAASALLNKLTEACKTHNCAIDDPSLKISLCLGFSTKQNMSDSLSTAEQEALDYMRKRKLMESRSHLNATFASIMATLDAKSHETEEHAQRIAFFTKRIGEKLGLPQKDMENLRLFSPLHDIGKIGVPDSILNKPGKLTAEEWSFMKKHTVIGEKIVRSVPDLECIADYTLYHHERWDGTGYPEGLSGEDIPLLSRILAVADAYDAMTSDRIYRKALSREEAIAEIKRNSGTQFDPEIADLFVTQVLAELDAY